jgi:glutamate transport system permease protein
VNDIERVLFDEPGPRGRRRIRVGSAIALVVIAALIAGAVWQFQANGQLSSSQWGVFGRTSVMRFLAEGLWATLRAALMAALLAVPMAMIAAFGRLSRNRAVRAPAAGYVEFLRAIPVLLLLYVFALLLPRYDVNLPPFWMLVFSLALSNSAALAEIFRAGILSIERGQTEAALAVGLTRRQTMRLVVVPQAVRRLAPALISQGIYLLKGTTLGYVVSYTELLHQAQDIGEYHNIFEHINGPLIQSYIVVMAIFVVINASLAKLGRVVEGHQRRRYGRSVNAEVTEDRPDVDVLTNTAVEDSP